MAVIHVSDWPMAVIHVSDWPMAIIHVSDWSMPGTSLGLVSGCSARLWLTNGSGAASDQCRFWLGHSQSPALFMDAAKMSVKIRSDWIGLAQYRVTVIILWSDCLIAPFIWRQDSITTGFFLLARFIWRHNLSGHTIYLITRCFWLHDLSSYTIWPVTRFV